MDKPAYKFLEEKCANLEASILRIQNEARQQIADRVADATEGLRRTIENLRAQLGEEAGEQRVLREWNSELRSQLRVVRGKLTAECYKSGKSRARKRG